jgi:hypothetical protein
MRIARSAADMLRDHVVLEYEAIDRMYLNVYVPHLQTVGAMVRYLRVHRRSAVSLDDSGGAGNHRAVPGKRSPNWMANWPIAAVHSTAHRQRRPAFLMVR